MSSARKRTAQSAFQSDLFGASLPPASMPEGFSYRPELIARDEDRELVRHIQDLNFKPFDFHGHLANRHVVGFGLRYDYERRQVLEAPPIPDFLLPLRAKVAEFAGVQAAAFAQVLINEYRPGAGIGWHRDKPHFELVAGVSLLAPCSFRLRRKNGAAWDRETIEVEPRSVYLMAGPSRNEWEHSIPPVNRHRYSVTFRTLRAG
ncbi:alpha-ketoglutarate-dependent dioxygenase AlkB [Mesorhizobium sp. M2D.F.Ca.ET.185.01.1.1]|uniref:alpha-ketoglutarate-dependent dioxygenase AlkB n=2 Tax=Mesorhizobium TaxID=68287 RepID=UPI000FC9B129|nr:MULTISPECIES: alpha-ketoglutarate-dependent dioxygenase AlkB [unclassified Mesorhizobium]TGP82987.1 alpha-ketoglutarate-dependent dioxygenase AlkB [bacterium M00.F.Ca.ET.227.01.1.1]TGP98944.1 alpha-ketoglutarate-dependent dioxygenase AlkB [bacterium M00.F.Ca.ET.221.01.1.1]TGP99674.1 alpha-ketoglutarate-dependent dioxygenase AlkB [bacterium M00.F.Ca.ET.222.01.1.1]TGT96954.1 alpha-ketoglutarate-dependent dioxygenase AlkB [bacterium M00.F.Ca.ET.163.01.1.1]TGU25229.1 alpha-ketoglutarate-depende